MSTPLKKSTRLHSPRIQSHRNQKNILHKMIKETQSKLLKQVDELPDLENYFVYVLEIS